MTTSLQNKNAIITGSSRGIGEAIALKLAEQGANVVIIGKTTEPNPKLEGTIYSVEAKAKAFGVKTFAFGIDIRDDEAFAAMVEKVAGEWGGIDILVNNASAISLTSTLDTQMKRYDLMMDINMRGTFACSRACIPYLKKANNPHILTMSPPINLQTQWFKQFVAYTMSKYGMSMVTLGLSQELKEAGIAVNSLWPQTTIATAAIKNLFPPQIYDACRTPEIVALAASMILQENCRELTGQFLMDESYLRSKGKTDFTQYSLNPSLPPYPDLFLT